MSVCCRCAPSSRSSRHASAIAATISSAACGKRPDASDLHWAPIDLVPAAEIADIRNSSLSTPYAAWALAVRHRQRAFVFWTYVIALAEDPLVRRTAEQLAHEALSDGNSLRRERRLAWRTERKINGEDAAKNDERFNEPGSAALLESLLLRDMRAWSQRLDPVQREQLLTLDPAPLPAPFPTRPMETTPARNLRRSNSSKAVRCVAQNNCPTSISMMPTARLTRAAWNWRRNLPRNPSCGSRACVISPPNRDYGDPQAQLVDLIAGAASDG